MLVWYPHPPVADVSLNIPPRVAGSRLGFRCGRFTIAIDEQALEQTGWGVAVQRAWRRISHVVTPFYGDVRKLSGFKRQRGRYWSTRETEQHPVVSWWWAGIPGGPVRAAVLGPPYRELWAAFRDNAESENDLSFISAADCLEDADALGRVGAPPSDVVHRPRRSTWFGSQRKYPRAWPFGAPFTSDS